MAVNDCLSCAYLTFDKLESVIIIVSITTWLYDTSVCDMKIRLQMTWGTFSIVRKAVGMTPSHAPCKSLAAIFVHNCMFNMQHIPLRFMCNCVMCNCRKCLQASQAQPHKHSLTSTASQVQPHKHSLALCSCMQLQYSGTSTCMKVAIFWLRHQDAVKGNACCSFCCKPSQASMLCTL